ncbi:MAG: dihydropteroate synthase [Candidatus Omnitrophota bacterium]
MRLKDHTLPIGERTCIMGVLNVTPDSFSDGGRYIDPEKAAERIKGMVDEGADVIDIGGESTRPGADGISTSEELQRIMPVIKAVKGTLSVPLSVDTYKSEVARQALMGGVSIVNDITALHGDPEMAGTIAEFDAGVVLMHMKGTPATMQKSPDYGDVIEEILSYLEGSIRIALDAGIDPEKIIIDPGIGFGKKLEHNLAILKDLKRLRQLGKPLLVGTSRKSFIGELTGKDIRDREFGTAASVALAAANGADMIRVHDVGSMKDVMRVVDAIRKA